MAKEDQSQETKSKTYTHTHTESQTPQILTGIFEKETETTNDREKV